MMKMCVLIPCPWVCKYGSLFTRWGQQESGMSSDLLKSAKICLTSRCAGALGQPGGGAALVELAQHELDFNSHVLVLM